MSEPFVRSKILSRDAARAFIVYRDGAAVSEGEFDIFREISNYSRTMPGGREVDAAASCVDLNARKRVYGMLERVGLVTSGMVAERRREALRRTPEAVARRDMTEKERIIVCHRESIIEHRTRTSGWCPLCSKRIFTGQTIQRIPGKFRWHADCAPA